MIKNMKRTMKQFISVLLMTVLILGLTLTMALKTDHIIPKAYADNYIEDMRAVWISTVWNVDFPAVRDNADAQQKEFITKLNTLQAAGINTIVVQVRPKADALYTSNINPWSEVLTGTQGKDPGYDPMAFMIEEAHKRNISFHAWLNPYRITTSGTDVNLLAATHPARLHPEWTITYNNALYYNPDLPEVRQHISDTIAEIVQNYDVDGIHFDDYFYPSKYPLPSNENRDGPTAQARREHVNTMVADVYRTIKSIDINVLFGISPIGIWKNASSDPNGSMTNGGEGYYSVFGDAKAWIQAGTVDYIAPQLYWKIGHSQADYETLVKWWSNLVSGTNVNLYIGQGIYTDAVAQEINQHLIINEKYANVKGDFYFSATDILNNRLGCTDQLISYYNTVDRSGITSTASNVFTDVPANAWYAEDVQAAYNLSIINGKGSNLFDPSGNLTIAEAITLAVKTRNLTDGTTFTAGGTNWYDNAVTYALQKNMIASGDFNDYNVIITREQMAYIFSGALPAQDYPIINEDVIVPDINGSPYTEHILRLYEGGILIGTGDDKTFSPMTNITRAEAAAIIHRVAVPENRIAF